MKESKTFNKKAVISIVLLSFLYVILCISINSFYYSQNKISRLIASEEQTILYPSDNPIVQSFYTPYKTVTGIYLYPNKSDEEGILNLSLIDEQSNVLGTWELRSEYIINGSPFFIPFDNIKLKENSLYSLYAVSDNSCIGIVAYTTGDNGYGSSIADGYTWGYQIEYKTFNYKVILIEVLFYILCVLVYTVYKKKIKEEKILCAVYLVFALIFFVITPVNSLFDEDGHFLRSYEIAQGHLLSGHFDNGMGKTIIPDSLIKGIKNVTKSLDSDGAYFLYARQKDLMNYSFSDDYVEIENPNQALYSPLSYIPQALGLLFANLISKNVYTYYMCGRFFAFIINALLIVFAIRLCPKRKELIFIIASTPVFLAQMISYSSDGNVNSLAIFYVAFIISRMNKEKLDNKDKLIVAICAVVLALSKVIYFPFALLVLMLDDSLFKEKKKAALYKGLVISAAFICFVIWFLIANTYLFDNQNGRDVQPKLQMIYMLTHFYMMPIVFVKTVYNGLLGWIGQISGGVLGKGWLQYSSIIWYSFMLLIGLQFFSGSRQKISDEISNSDLEKKTIKKEYIIGLTMILIILLTFSSLYVQWTTYRAGMVDGIQGRYFIPLILPLSYLIKKDDSKKNENSGIYTMSCIIIVLCAIINTINVYM